MGLVITDARAEEAFEFLRDTVQQIGDAKGELERSEIMRKRVRRKHFVTTEGSVALREAQAENMPDTEAADERYVKAVSAYESLRARREIEAIALDVWRTEAANRRRA